MIRDRALMAVPPAESTLAERPIVVGVDGSEPSLAATRWAATEADLRDLPLRLVHAYQPHAYQPYQAWPQIRARQADPHAILTKATNAARAERASVPIAGQAHPSPPAQTLIGLSGQASMVVVGHRGQGCGSPLRDLRSPIGSALTAHARSTVAVIRLGRHVVADRVVVGVDGSTASTLALGFAFEEAALRNVPLEVVRAFPCRRTADQSADFDTAARQLHEWVRHWHEAHPRLPVSLTVAPAHPITVLIQASERAGLLVVGARGIGGAQGLPVGSVTQQLVHLAACPVLVVRPAAQPAPNVPGARRPERGQHARGGEPGLLTRTQTRTQRGASQ